MSEALATPRDDSAPADPAAWHRPALLILAVALAVSVIGFGWTLGGHFLGDDFGYVGRFYNYPLTLWPRLFVESWAGDMWGFQLRELRPVTALSFMVDARIWGGNATGFRVTNLLLHAAAAGMVGLIAWRAAGRDLLCGLAAGVLFALHPAHAEPVQWITGRVDVLATTLYLAGFLAFIRFRTRGHNGWLVALGVIYGTASFSKEFGLTLPLMLMMADAVWLRTWRKWREWPTWAPYVICIVCVTGYFFCRRAAFGADGAGAAPPDWGSADFQRLFARRQLIYFGHLFPTLERWWFENAPLLNMFARRTFLFAALGGLALLAAWRWGARHRPVDERRAAVSFGLGWYLVATLPLVVTYISARHLYLASAGLSIAAALILRGLLRPRVVFAVAILAVGGLFVQRLSVTMKPWHAAAVLSGTVAKELRALEPLTSPGGALFLDVPEIREGAYVWTWAVPFALRPPFTHGRLDQREVVLESRGLYVDWERWHEQPAVAALRQVQAESWIVQLLPEQPLKRIPVPAARVRVAAEHFAAEPVKQFPHESWRKLINEMTAP